MDWPTPGVAAFPLYTLDYIQGTVLLPNAFQLATLDGNVDLRAQATGTTGVTYSWNTTGLTDATGIAGASTYDLTFTWSQHVATAAVNSVTLTATNSSSQQVVQTYYFQVPAGNVTTNTGSRQLADDARAQHRQPRRPRMEQPVCQRQRQFGVRSTPRSTCPAITRMCRHSH